MKLKTLAAAVLIVAGTNANATTIQFDFISSGWTNPSGGNILAIDGPYTDPSSIAWGQAGLTPLTESSGYTFASRTTPFQEIASPLDPFALGTFTHYNNPIESGVPDNAGSAIDSVVLDIRTEIKVINDDNVVIFDDILDFSFLVTHDETPNGSDPCAYADDGSDPGGDINRNGCADAVNIVVLGDNTFNFDGEDVLFEILGFAAFDNNGEFFSFNETFFTAEDRTNDRVLVAQFSNTSPVPEPSAAFLLLSGFGLLAASRRRRKAS